MMGRSDSLGSRRIHRFDEAMLRIEEGKYEAPTAVRLKDGRWCLFLDYYGVAGSGQGYVPFIAPSLKSGAFLRSDSEFFFPYGLSMILLRLLAIEHL